MEKNPLRISRLLVSLTAAAIVVGCATTPQPVPEPEPAPAPAPEPVITIMPQPVEPPEVKAEAPVRYVVMKGDTLWGIASRFLTDPWRWPEVWDFNPQVANPHLIYPGDVLLLGYKDGRPVIQLEREGIVSTTTGRVRPEVRLSPKTRVETLDRAIPTIPIDAIRPFLTRHRVVGPEELAAAPYIVSSVEQHLATATGNRVYVRGLTDPELIDYVVVRPGEAYRNPENPREILGFEAIFVASARLKQYGDVSTLQLSEATREVLNGDRLIPANDVMPSTNFLPRAPKNKVKAYIIAVPGGVALIGQYQVVAINLGQQEEIEPGNVLAVYQSGEVVRDRFDRNKEVKMPDEYAGVMMVFRTFDRVSYGLVMKALRPMHVKDVVTNP